MNHMAANFTKGMVAGIIVTSAVMTAVSGPTSRKKVATAKRKASKTIHAIGTALDSFNF